MIDNPADLPYPEGVYTSVTIKARRLENKTWEVYCPEWHCVLYDKNLTACVANLMAEIELHNEEEETGNVSPFNSKYDQNVWRQEHGFCVLKEQALPKRPISSFRKK